MGISALRTSGRLLAPVVAVVLLAGVSLEAGAYGNKGQVRLRLNQSPSADGFYHYDNTGALVAYQYFSLPKSTKCVVDESGWVQPAGSGGEPKLVDVSATGPTGSGDPKVGLIDGMLGVYDGSKGTSCGRMTAGYGERLNFTSVVGGFDRLELDMELKGNAIFKLTVDPGSSERVYFLYSGTNRQAGVTAVDVNGLPAATPADRFRNCEGSSDSGPDSGPNDNCRWVIADVGGSFTLEPTAGEGSLEGGGDYVGTSLDPAEMETIIHLTSLIDVGQLSCNPSPASPDNVTARVFSDSEPAASCQVTRIATTDSACDYVLGYKLETFTFESRCSLDKSVWVNPRTGAIVDPADDSDPDIQLAGSNQITFNLEDRDVWDIDKTYMTFTKYVSGVAQQTPKYDLHRCGGTVIYVDGQPTIKEVLEGNLEGYLDADGFFVAGPPDGWDGYSPWSGYVKLSDTIAGGDAVPGNGLIDWACILDNTELYEGSDKMRVIQHILFWGDANWARN